MPKLTLMLTHGCCTADTTDTDMDIMLHSPTPMLPMSTPMPTPTMVSHMLTMVRDLQMLNQRLMLVLTLMLMLTMDITDTDSDHTDTMDTELDTMAIHTDTDTGERSNFYCQNALNRIQPCFQ